MKGRCFGAVNRTFVHWPSAKCDSVEPMPSFLLLHRRTDATVGQFGAFNEALSAYERIRDENPHLAAELILIGPDEAEVVAHGALEFGQ